MGECLCSASFPLRLVYCTFSLRDGWSVQLPEAVTKTAVGRIRTFADPDKMRLSISRTLTKMNGEAKQALKYGISRGRGGLYLDRQRFSTAS